VNAPLPSGHFPDADTASAPRFREVGEMVLDQFHRDARVDDRWLDLAPREFALLWRLAASPGERLAPPKLRIEAWRIVLAPDAGDIDAQLETLRAKLASAGVGHLICTDGDGRTFVAVPPTFGLSQPV
jgi:DNA-binding response OmpR family regulator